MSAVRSKAADGFAAGAVKIDIRDFGPTRRGSMDLLPMTVLLGPNNSGKSYAALLVRSMLGNKRGSAPSGHLRKAKYIATTPKSTIDGSTPVRDDVVEDLVGEFCAHFQERIMDRIKGAFLDDFASLIRFGAEKCTVRMQTNRITARIRISNKRHTCKVLPSAKPSISLNRARNGNLTYRVEDNSIFIDAPRSARDLESIVLDSMHDYLEPDAAFYLPAARSGILQGHKAISANIIRHAPYAGRRKVELANLSGTVADFIGDIIEMPPKRGPFYDVASELEKEVLQGQIEIERKLTTSDIKYIHKRHSIPIHRVSSTVSEMAPFILYLKHMISKKSTLIIEEPEAHLHPHNQAIFAKYLVRLVRLGLRVVLTTHSPFILDQLSNLIQAGSTAARQAGVGLAQNGPSSNLNLGPNDYLNAAEVAAYAFKHSQGAYDIRRLDVDDEGIPADEFVKASDELHVEYLAIQDRAINGI